MECDTSTQWKPHGHSSGLCRLCNAQESPGVERPLAASSSFDNFILTVLSTEKEHANENCRLDSCLVFHLTNWPDLCCKQQHCLKLKVVQGAHHWSSAHTSLKLRYKCSTGKPQKYVGLPTKSRARLTNDVNEDTQLPMKWSDFIRIAQSITGNHGSAWKTWTCVQEQYSTRHYHCCMQYSYLPSRRLIKSRKVHCKTAWADLSTRGL